MSHAETYARKIKNMKKTYGDKNIVFNKLESRIKDFKDSIPLI